MANLTGTRSSFPNQIDTFRELYDLPASKKQSAFRYQELKTKDVLSPSDVMELNTLTTELQDYLVTPEYTNKMLDSVVNLQTFFKNNVQGFIETKQVAMQTYMDEKKAEMQLEIDKFQDKGDYNPNITYVAKNFVAYNGNTYIALQTNKGVTPADDGVRWRKLTIQGERGLSGVGLVWKGQFVYGTPYLVNDLIRYSDGLYVCKQNTNGSQYPTTITHWEIFLMISGNKVYKNKTMNQNPTKRISIGVSEYNPVFDELMVIQNSVWLDENDDYTIDEQTKEIILKEPVNSGTTFSFKIIQNGKLGN